MTNLLNQKKLNNQLLQQQRELAKIKNDFMNQKTTTGETVVPQEVGNDLKKADDDPIEFNVNHLSPAFPSPQTPTEISRRIKGRNIQS